MVMMMMMMVIDDDIKDDGGADPYLGGDLAEPDARQQPRHQACQRPRLGSQQPPAGTIITGEEITTILTHTPVSMTSMIQPPCHDSPPPPLPLKVYIPPRTHRRAGCC
jgi:hypothetical protein